MTKNEFLEALRSKLLEDLPPEVVESEVRYYEGYLDGEISRGKTEEQAAAELGDPILIARTIIESPHDETVFGRVVQSGEDAYYEGAFQAENSADESFEDDGRTVAGAGFENTAGISAGVSSEDTAESVQGRVETGKHSIFRMDDGSFNWSFFAGILAAVMIAVALISIVTRVLIGFAPVILVILAVVLLVKTIGGAGRR